MRPPGGRRPVPTWASPGEVEASFYLLASVFAVLGMAKGLGQVPYLGPVVLTLAAFWQLRAPLWRLERLDRGLAELGCHFGAWRLDLKTIATLSLGVLPLYAGLYHLWLTQGVLSLRTLCPWLGEGVGLGPTGHAVWHLPATTMAWAKGSLWFCERGLTHTFGVALPEELFYRGYLQPVWQTRWPAKSRFFAAELGAAAVGVSGAFALGHWLGEWQLSRLGPFFPSLLFAWQRARSGTIVGAVGLHALCNLFAEVWATQYAVGA